MTGDLYSDAFFADVERTAAGSARRVVPVAVREWRPAHVVDVGCGEGIWAASFEALGGAGAGNRRRLRAASGRWSSRSATSTGPCWASDSRIRSTEAD